MKWVIFELFLFVGLPALVYLAVTLPRFRSALVGMVLASTVYTVSVNFYSQELYRGPDRGYEVTLTDLIVLSLAIALLVVKKGRLCWIPYNSWWLAAYFALACLSVTNAVEPLYSYFTLFKLLKGYLLYWTVYNALADRFSLAALWWGAVAAVGVETVTAVYQKYVYGLYRIYGTFDHSNTVSPYCLMLLPMLLIWALHGEKLSRRQTIVSLVAVLGICFCVVATMSRAAAVLMGLSIVAVIFVSLLWRRSYRQFGIAAALGLLMLAGGTRALDTYWERFTKAPTASKTAREEFNEAAAMMVRDHPWGVGVNAFSYVLTNTPEYRAHIRVLKTEEQAGVCHHLYRLTSAEMGPAGLVVLLVIFARFAWLPLRQLWGPGSLQRQLLLGLVMGTTILHVFGLVEWVFRMTPITDLYLFTSAVTVVLAERLQAERREPWSLLRLLRVVSGSGRGTSAWEDVLQGRRRAAAASA